MHLYWIPLFRVGDGEDVLRCQRCRHQWREGTAGDARETTWRCGLCGNVNALDAEECLRCGGLRGG